MSYFIYILLCSDGSFYTGSTNDLEKRLKDHIDGRGARYTKSHKPEKIIYQEEFTTKSKALKREAEIKKWSKAKKEEFIASQGDPLKNFWQELPKPFTVLAPMDDVTDNLFRQIILEAARPDVFFTEFVNADGLVYHSSPRLRNDYALKELRVGPLRKLLFTKDQHPIVAQIWGNNPKNMEKAGRIAAKLGFDGIDINMGCPVREVVKKGAGAGLIGNYELAEGIIKSVKKGAGKIPVSVKTRLGINKNVAESWATFLLKQGLAALTIHARTAKEISKVPADWDEIKKIVKIRDELAPKTLIIGNGDVKFYSEVTEKGRKYGVDGVMVGRGIFANPWVFAEAQKEHSKEDYINLLKKHIELFEKNLENKKHFAVIKKFFKMYIKGFEGANSLRQKLMETASLEEIKAIISQIRI